MKSLQLRGHRQIAEPRKYYLVCVIVFFGVCFLYLFYFSQVGILVKFPTKAKVVVNEVATLVIFDPVIEHILYTLTN